MSNRSLGRLPGEGAPLSGNTVPRLKKRWEPELQSWQTKKLDHVEAVHL